MSKIEETKYRLRDKIGQSILEEMVGRLETIIELKNQDKESDGDKAINDMKDWLEGYIKNYDKSETLQENNLIKRNEFPAFGEVVAEGKKIILGVLKIEEKEKYLAVNSEYSCFKKLFTDEMFCEQVWKDFISDNTFVCSIYERKSGEYVGYCSVKDLRKSDLELVIELLSNECHKGYGTEALPLLMKVIYRLTGKRFYRVRVEIDNHASQGLMKKIGAIPNGISEFMLHGEDINKFQEENKNMITDDIRAVAAEFCMNAEDVLGHVLEYRFDVENQETDL